VLFRRHIHLRIVELKSVASHLFDTIHCGIGITHQGFSIFTIMGEDTDAYTGRYVECVA